MITTEASALKKRKCSQKPIPRTLGFPLDTRNEIAKIDMLLSKRTRLQLGSSRDRTILYK